MYVLYIGRSDEQAMSAGAESFGQPAFEMLAIENNSVHGRYIGARGAASPEAKSP